MTRLGYFITLAFCLGLTGCFPVRGEFYTPLDSAVVDEDRLQLQGYYAYEWVTEKGERIVRPVVLWEDGTAAVFVGSSGVRDQSGSQGGDSFEAGHRYFREELREVTGERGREQPAWGVFRIEGDSIEIQVMRRFDYGGSGEYRAIVDKGLILNDSTFKITSLITPGTGYAPHDEVDWTFRFFALEEKPSSANWTQTHPKLQ